MASGILSLLIVGEPIWKTVGAGLDQYAHDRRRFGPSRAHLSARRQLERPPPSIGIEFRLEQRLALVEHFANRRLAKQLSLCIDRHRSQICSTLSRWLDRNTGLLPGGRAAQQAHIRMLAASRPFAGRRGSRDRDRRQRRRRDTPGAASCRSNSPSPARPAPGPRSSTPSSARRHGPGRHAQIVAPESERDGRHRPASPPGAAPACPKTGRPNSRYRHRLVTKFNAMRIVALARAISRERDLATDGELRHRQFGAGTAGYRSLPSARAQLQCRRAARFVCRQCDFQASASMPAGDDFCIDPCIIANNTRRIEGSAHAGAARLFSCQALEQELAIDDRRRDLAGAGASA